MQLLNNLLFLTSLLLPLVSSEACVAGGPATQVSFAKECCFRQAGTWYQFYDVQAICVFTDDRTPAYKHCVSYIPYSQLDTTCIPGNGGVGLAPGETATLTTTARITFTPTPDTAVASSTASAFVS